MRTSLPFEQRSPVASAVLFLLVGAAFALGAALTVFLRAGLHFSGAG
jgi:hypothetical protein